MSGRARLTSDSVEVGAGLGSVATAVSAERVTDTPGVGGVQLLVDVGDLSAVDADVAGGLRVVGVGGSLAPVHHHDVVVALWSSPTHTIFTTCIVNAMQCTRTRLA